MTKELINITDLEAAYQALVADVDGLQVTNDLEYALAADLTKTIAGKLKELGETDIVAEKKRFYAEYKKYSDIESTLKKKLDKLSATVRSKISRYVTEKEAAARREAEERALAAAVATNDSSFLEMVPEKVEATPEIAGVSYATIIDFEITDPVAIPEQYKIIDEKAIRAAVRASGLATKIPGVRVYEKKQMRVSA